MESVTFDNKNYPIRELYLEEFDNVIISTHELNDALLEEDGTYISKNAQHLDESIFYFVKGEEIELEESSLKRLILQNL